MRRSLRVDRLSIRLALGSTIVVLSLLGIGFAFLSRHHLNHTIEARQRAGELQNRVLVTALRHQMVEKDDTLLTAILGEIGAEDEVQSASILDHEGKVRLSSEPELVGTTISRDSPTCLVCHSKEPEDRDRWVVIGDEDSEVLRSVLPIENRSECHRCHDPAKRMNGILILDISLAGVQRDMERETRWMLAGTAVLGVLLLAGVSLLVRRLILVRLVALRETAQAIAAGDLAARAPVDGDDIITSLATDFNDMAVSISRLVAEVQEQETHLVSVMSSLDDGLVVLDRHFRIVACNRSFSRRLQCYPEALRGGNCLELVRDSLPCQSKGPECPAHRCIATGMLQRETFTFPAKGGGPERVEEVHASPIFDDEGKVREVVEVWRDISERVREEERLAEIERLVSLGSLASGFSHEVNTPLASMLVCAEAVVRTIDQTPSGSGEASALPAIRENAETIRHEIYRCRKITEQFLRFSRGIPPSIEPFDLREAVASVVVLAGPTARSARAKIRVEDGSQLPAVRANPEVVQHVFLNLLVNAIQSFDHRGGTVTIRFRAGSDVRVEVEDDGSGIAHEAQEFLFRPFRTAKPMGTGLGLFLSRLFMQRFGGDVRLLRSDPGTGTLFEVVFALAGEERG